MTQTPDIPGSAATPPQIFANRAQGELGASFAVNGSGRTYTAHVHEAGGLRLRFPKVAPGLVPNLEAVCINTGGGMVGGDTARLAFTFGSSAAATMTTQAAEKIYRSTGATTSVETRLRLEAGAQAEWLPQETILFDEVRFARRLEVDMAKDASLLLVESLVFGRLAMGESVRTGEIQDHWRVRRDGALVFAEALRLDGTVSQQLDRAALGNGARAAGTLLFVAPEAESRLAAVRDALAHTACPSGASAWNGLLTVRLLSRSPEQVRAAIVGILVALRGRAAPRVWQ